MDLETHWTYPDTFSIGLAVFKDFKLSNCCTVKECWTLELGLGFFQVMISI